MGRDRWDAIIFAPNKNIKVFGIGIFDKHPAGGEFTIGYKYYIEEADGTISFTSELVEELVNPDPEQVENHVIWYHFQTFK